jgi:hypothetical protein
MKHFRITEVATGNVVEYDAEFPQPEHLSNAFIAEEVSEAVPAPDDEQPVYAGSWHITKLAFRNRFTQAEKVAIEIAGLDNPAASMPQRAQAAALRASQQDVAVATFIDLKRADTRAGVQTLEAAGLLAAGRAAVILDTEPVAEELFNG